MKESGFSTEIRKERDKSGDGLRCKPLINQRRTWRFKCNSMGGNAVTRLCYSRWPAMENDVSTQPQSRITPQEYLALERQAECRSEYLDGEMFAMSGATRQHSAIVINITTELNQQFIDRPCEVHGPNMRVKASATGLYAYPDVLALCGEPQFEDAYVDTLINPQVIIEVLSESTESYDRGRKFAHYRTIDSLREYVLVSQIECRIEKFSRHDDGIWLYSETTDPAGVVELISIVVRLPLARVYSRISFERSG